MSAEKIRGVFPIAPATFDHRGAFDYDSYRAALRAMIQGGCPGVTLFGIAGEYYKLSYDEELAALRITVEECHRLGVPCIVSNTRHATEVAVDWAKTIADAGADCMMVLPPFFLKPGGQALYEHMREVSKAVDLPVMIQYAPEQTGVAIDPAILAQLCQEVSNIKFYKIECKPPGGYISRLLQLVEGRTAVFVGNAGFQLIEGYDRGAVGVMPGASMFDLYLQVTESYRQGDRQRAIKVHTVLVAMLNHIRQNVEMIIRFEKEIMYRRGIIANPYCRRPSYTIDKKAMRIFDELYAMIEPYFTYQGVPGTPAG